MNADKLFPRRSKRSLSLGARKPANYQAFPLIGETVCEFMR